MIEWPTWLKAIAQVGFPIVVALWLIFRVDPAVMATKDMMADHKLQVESSLKVQRLICRSVAKSELIALECDK